MKVEVKKRANNSFTKLLHWIEIQNTTHAAQKWSDEFYDYLEHLASIKVNYTICKDPNLPNINIAALPTKTNGS